MTHICSWCERVIGILPGRLSGEPSQNYGICAACLRACLADLAARHAASRAASKAAPRPERAAA
ncbi:MAG: hypothetical protein OEW02_08770 [Myxococcales bacterium]|nr:hypothetical protein [Myxococcales bacterium]MDH5565565.1 hypothetical protein [Myxococcales bacterium]